MSKAPEQLRALLVAEAEVGERVMRALLLRRVAILETGAGGPVIVGRSENGNVLRLQVSVPKIRFCNNGDEVRRGPGYDAAHLLHDATEIPGDSWKTM